MSQIIQAITDAIQIIADNPASILIVLGFISVLIAIFVQIETDLRLLLGALGLFMIVLGIYAHFKWLEK